MLSVLKHGVRGLICLLVLGVIVPPAMAARGEKWLRVATPEFTLVTTLSEKEAVIWAGEFTQYIAELRSLFNFRKPLTPLTIVIFARDRSFQDYRPLTDKGTPAAVAGFFLRHESWAVAGLSGADASSEVRRTIFHEGVHWFLSAMDRNNPVWIEEGLAEVFSTFAVTKGRVHWGEAIPEHVTTLRVFPQMPMDRLVFVTRGELFLDESSRTGIVYAQSWAAVHLILYGKNEKLPRGGLFQFMQLTHDGMPMVEAFRESMNMEYAEFDRLLHTYLQGGTYYIASKAVQKLAPLTAEAAPSFEVAQALGRLALAARRWEKAVSFAQECINIAPDDPRGYELLGMARQESGDREKGFEAFTTAVEKGSKDYQPYFELAFRAQQAAANAAGEVSELPPAEARAIADNYERAIALYPRLLASYQNLAGIVGLAEPQLPQDRECLETGRKMFPKDGMIRAGLAVLTERSGNRAAALKEMDELSDDADQPARVRAFARNLFQNWKQKEVSERLEKLHQEKKFAEALVYLEEQMGQTTNSALRAQLTALRPQLRASLRSEEIASAFNEERWDDARQLLKETIDNPDMPASLRKRSEQALEDLDRRLGLQKKSRR
jgi:tetratricopeptide (TPR) repeat protein